MYALMTLIHRSGFLDMTHKLVCDFNVLFSWINELSNELNRPHHAFIYIQSMV